MLQLLQQVELPDVGGRLDLERQHPPPLLLFDVVLRESIAPLVLGYTFIFIGVVDMSAVAGYIGGGGLGDLAITYGYQQFNYAVTLLAVGVIVVIVQLAQLLGNALAKRMLHR